MSRTTFLLPILLLGLFASGCSFRSIGKDLVLGVNDSADTLATTIATSLIRTTEDQLRQSEIREYIDSVVDSLLAGVNQSSADLRDTLLSNYTRQQIAALKSELVGDGTREQIRLLMSEVIGARSQNMIGNLRDELLGDEALARLMIIQAELLGQSTRVALRAIVDSAMTGVGYGYRTRIHPELGATADVIGERLNITAANTEKIAKSIMIWGGVIGAALLLLAGYFVFEYLKRRKALEIMAGQIREVEIQNPDFNLEQLVKDAARESKVGSAVDRVFQQIKQHPRTIGD